MMRLILMRHGETTWNAESRLQGQDNSSLSERGIEQVRRFRAILKALNPARVVASDLGRTRQTAALIGHGDCPSDARLREWDMGSWTGKTKPELIAANAELYHSWRAGQHTPEGSEPWSVFRARVEEGLRDWMGRGTGDLLAVVHGGVTRAALHAFLDLPPSRVIPVTPGTGTILSFPAGGTGQALLEGYNIGSVVPDLSVAD